MVTLDKRTYIDATLRVTTIHRCIYGTIIRGHCGLRDYTVRSQQLLQLNESEYVGFGSYQGFMIQHGSM